MSSSHLLAYVSQISRPVETSQALVFSSRLTIPSLPDGGRCCGQTSKMWSTVCSGAPHSQTEESLRPHFSMDELNRPTPVRRRLRVVHCFRGKSRPGTLSGSRMKLCSLEGGAASQSSFQRVLSQDCFVTPGGAKSLRRWACWETGRRDFKRARVGLSWSILWRRWSSFAWALRHSARTAASRRKVGGAMPERMGKWLTGVARRHPETVRMALLTLCLPKTEISVFQRPALACQRRRFPSL